MDPREKNKKSEDDWRERKTGRMRFTRVRMSQKPSEGGGRKRVVESDQARAVVLAPLYIRPLCVM